MMAATVNTILNTVSELQYFVQTVAEWEKLGFFGR